MQGTTLAPVALVTTAWLASSSRHTDARASASSRHADVVSAFLLYHVSIGVTKIFVFFDGDRESQLDVTDLHPRVQVLCAAGRIAFYYHNNSESSGVEAAAWHSRYERCANWSRLSGSADHDVAARQMLNAEVAMQLCLEHNQGHAQSTQQQHTSAESIDPPKSIGELRWLLHLDMDELFYLDAFASDSRVDALAAFVARLETQHVEQLTIANSEAVPTQLFGCNYFANTTTFKCHPTRVPLTSAAQRKLAFWQERTAHGQFFLYYDNGKSLVRVRAGVAPTSVHHWHSVSPRTSSSTTTLVGSKTNFYDARQNAAPQDVLFESEGSRTSILHYAVCGLEWLHEKYARLGRFPDVWGGRGSQDRAIPIAPCFHTQARDIITSSSSSGGSGLETLYRTHVMLDVTSSDGAREWHEQVAAGVCDVIRFPQELLATYGLTDDECEGECEEALRSENSSTTPSSDMEAPVARATKDETAPFSVEKAWMLASISQQYL